jgi:transposase-like protein
MQEYGELELAIPRDSPKERLRQLQGTFEPMLVPKHQHRSLRKVIKTKAVFPDEASVFKLMYLAMNNISKRWNRPIQNWKAAASHFAILFPERFKV